MSKRKRQKTSSRGHSTRDPKSVTTGEHGFDFGIEARTMLVSDPSFIQLLREAEIVGCAYNYAGSSPLGVPMREIAVVGRNKEPLAKAFEVFKRWVPQSLLGS